MGRIEEGADVGAALGECVPVGHVAFRITLIICDLGGRLEHECASCSSRIAVRTLDSRTRDAVIWNCFGSKPVETRIWEL